MLASGRELMDDALAGRTVWCAAGLPAGRATARALRVRLHADGGEDVPVRSIEIASLEPPTERLVRRLDGIVAGGESLIGDEVAADDVVVLHDALAVALAQAVRERGAHAVWLVRAGRGPHESAIRAAEVLLRRRAAVDAYATTWTEPLGRGRLVERVMALLPAAGLVEVKEVAALAPARTGLGWRSALAGVVGADRDDHVGGTLHARPVVAPR